MSDELIPANAGEFLFYHTEDGQVRLQVRIEAETVWLTQKQMADLFQTTKQNVSLHIQNIFEEGELLHYAGDYHQRSRQPGSDVDVCFGGQIAVTLVRLI